MIQIITEKMKNVMRRMLFCLVRKKCIVFESAPDFSDNTKAVFDEMVRRGLNRKYRFVWLCYDGKPEYCPKGRNIICVDGTAKKSLFYLYTAKALISCNRFQKAWLPEQYSIYLEHGTPLKDFSKVMRFEGRFNHLLCASKNIVPIIAKGSEIEDFSKLLDFGYPRNDAFSRPARNLREIFEGDFQKIIVWYPTFRQIRGVGRDDGGNALPIIHSEDAAEELNRFCNEQGILLVLKPHFAQDVSKLRAMNLSNIRFIDDNFYRIHKIESYEFLNACDALLTDYSSVYYDYTLCDKPIGLIWEDIEEYKRGIGLVENYEYLAKGGVKIYTLPELESFLRDVVNGNDVLRNERREIRDFANNSTDGKNSERVTDYIILSAKL